ncbi:MAG: hypothetical protein A3G80_13835 [Betaproteobacteria bacterium RIFCSPLOWO2_12_FULL_62_13b]|nr:MAG: hypothetical protein A3G80_13835 [Betaproteobacteria bacterium RIFCSPLOWO2_12_FULL_62_13b]
MLVIVPEVQAAALVGVEAELPPFAEPQTPGVEVMGTVQVGAATLEPPLIPVQPQVKLLAPATIVVTSPVSHALVPVGAALTGVLLTWQAALTILGAEQAVADVLVPPPAPLQPHVKFQGEPDGVATPVAVPVEHRLLLGADATGVLLLDEPQAPLVGAAPNVAVAVRRTVMLSTQAALVAVPAQSPPQLAKAEPGSAVGVRATLAPVS